MSINDIPLQSLKEILASDTPLAIETTEALIARLESSGMRLDTMRRQRDGYQAQARKAEQAVARVRALCMTTDGDYLDNEETVNTVGDILEGLDGDGRA